MDDELHLLNTTHGASASTSTVVGVPAPTSSSNAQLALPAKMWLPDCIKQQFGEKL